MIIQASHNLNYNDLVLFAQYLLDRDGMSITKKTYLQELRTYLTMEGSSDLNRLHVIYGLKTANELKQSAIELIDKWFSVEG